MQSQNEKTTLNKIIGVLASIALVFTMATAFVVVSTPASMAGEQQATVVSTEGGLSVGETNQAVDTKSLGKNELVIEDEDTPMASAADLAGGISESESLLRGLGISVAAVLVLLAAGGTSMLLTMRSRKRQ